MRTLDEVRRDIDVIDSTLAVLVADRVRLSREAKAVKVEMGIGRVDPTREEAIVEKYGEGAAREVGRRIVEACRDLA